MGSNINVLNDTNNAASSAVMSVASNTNTSGDGPPFENILNQYASYNYIITISALSNSDINSPKNTYKTNEPDSIILRSGGSGDKKAVSDQESNDGIITDLYVDNLEILSLIGANTSTRFSNAITINFTVIEPYSMGMFLESLKNAAINKGFKNYINAPFLLTIEFVGWYDDGTFKKLKDSTRKFPIELIDASFTVDNQGSKYNVKGIAWNDQGFSDDRQSIKFDITMEGGTINEMMQTGYKSLATILNKKEQELKEQGKKDVADEYVILFPSARDILEGSVGASSGGSGDNSELILRVMGVTQDFYQGHSNDPDSLLEELEGFEMETGSIGDNFRQYAEDEGNLNGIGKSKIEETHLKKGISHFSHAPFVEDENNPGTFKRGNIVISNNATIVHFKRGERIQDIIEEVILLSDYAREFFDKKEDEFGMKTWFKIESNVYIGEASDDMGKTGDKPKIFVYKVIPYELNVSAFKSPTAPTPGVSRLREEVIKEYDYMYTGKNDSIIDFNIDINYAYISAVQSDFGIFSDKGKLGSSSDLVEDEGEQDQEHTLPESSDPPEEGSGATRATGRPHTGGSGGGPRNTADSQIVRNISDIITSGVDLIQLNLKIWGDPYFISDTGVGNYTAEKTDYINMTADGTMDYQYSDVDILVNFRTPSDIGNNGMMTFPSDSDSSMYVFSGLYRVYQVLSLFSEGKFIQELTLVRRHNQDIKSYGSGGKTEMVIVEV